MEKLTQTSFGKAFLLSLSVTLAVYLLRGFGLLSMMPGYVLLLLVGLSLGLGMLLSLRR
ncbi:MAG: hypothetical protein AAGB01_02415 [Cyanobacteria bacterium P01_F01_bin.42]